MLTMQYACPSTNLISSCPHAESTKQDETAAKASKLRLNDLPAPVYVRFSLLVLQYCVFGNLYVYFLLLGVYLRFRDA